MRRPEHDLTQAPRRRDGVAGSAALAAGFGFFVFLPYPAPFMGIQVGHVMGVCILAYALFLRTPLFSWRLLPLILVPGLISAAWVTVSGEGNSDIAWKVFAAFAASVLVVGATEAVLLRNPCPFFAGVAIAILLHAAVGAYQLYSFRNDEFPFVELYVNSSFRSVQDDAEKIARWSKRPFGVFPEPSAMAASVTPFVLLWLAVSLQIVRTRFAVPRMRHLLFQAAAAAGLLLMLAARSGHAVVALLGVAVLLLQWALRARLTARNLRRVVLIALGLPFLLWYGGSQLVERAGADGRFDTESWRERRASLVAGLELLGDQGPGAVITGVGVGQAPGLIKRKTGADAIWSVLINHLVETGLVGCIGAMAAAALTWWHVRRGQGSGVLAVIGTSWIVGITITTSYSSLLPLWATLALICAWPGVMTNDVQGAAVPQYTGRPGWAPRSRNVTA